MTTHAEGAAKLFRFFFFHYPDPQSAWQSGTCHQANLFLIVSFYDYVGSSALTSCVWKTVPYWRVNWLRARNVEIVLRKFHFRYFFRPNLLLTLFLPVENGSNDFFASKTVVVEFYWQISSLINPSCPKSIKMFTTRGLRGPPIIHIQWTQNESLWTQETMDDFKWAYIILAKIFVTWE